jgi:hypothetical protein
MSCLWYEDIPPEQLADVLELPSEKLYDKIFGDDDFTAEEIKEIVALLGLTEEEANTIFG